MTENQQYKKAMVAWAKEVAKWQIENPTRDWATELFGVTSADDDGGSNPPSPPPKPPVNP